MAEITIDWNAVSGADSYNVYHRSGGSKTYLHQYTKVANTTDTQYTETRSTGTHSYRIVTIDGARLSAPSANIQIGVPGVPSNPTFTDTSTQGELTVGWDEVNNGSTYRVYRATESGSTTAEYTQIAEVSGAPYTDTGVTGGEQYYYRISAVSADDLEGDGSSEVTTQPRFEFDERLTWWDTVTAGDPVPFDAVYASKSESGVHVQDGELLITPRYDVTIPDPGDASILAISGTVQRIQLATDTGAGSFSPSNTITPSDRVVLRSDGSDWYVLE